MNFQYGISERSLARWMMFQRICTIQADGGPDVGASVIRLVVDAELDAIADATARSANYEDHTLRLCEFATDRNGQSGGPNK